MVLQFDLYRTTITKIIKNPLDWKQLIFFSCDKSFNINSDIKIGIKQRDTEKNVFDKIPNYIFQTQSIIFKHP